MLGLEAAGTNPRDLGRPDRSPVDFLRRKIGEARSPGDLARTILALRGAGIDARHFAGRDLAARLAGRRRSDGSYVGWPGSTAFAVMALRASGLQAGISRSLGWLRQNQSAEGGWGAVPAGPSDPDTTGAVLQALGPGSPATHRGVRYLRGTQRPGGGWALAASGPLNSQSTSWAIQGLLAAGVNPSSVRRGGHTGLDYLAARRAGDGHYRYSKSSDQTPVWVTAQALAAAERKPFPLAPVPRASSAGGAGGRGTGARGDGRDGGGAGSGGGVIGGPANGGGEGGAGAPSERFAPERAKRIAQGRGGSSREWRVRRGSGTVPAPESQGRAASRAVSGTADAPGGDGGEGTSSPLVPIGIAVAAAAAVLVCGWGAARGLRA
jgi:hypothetical protein